jgi:hypothetical protein
VVDAKDIYWTAGFIEGEGYFCTWNSGASAVVVSQVQREPLERLQAMYGGSLARYQQLSNPRANAFYRWTLMGPDARGLMMTIYSLMSPKRKRQIEKVLKVWRSHKPKAEYRTHCPRGHAYEGANLMIHSATGGRVCRECANGLRTGKYRRLEI